MGGLSSSGSLAGHHLVAHHLLVLGMGRLTVAIGAVVHLVVLLVAVTRDAGRRRDRRVVVCLCSGDSDAEAKTV